MPYDNIEKTNDDFNIGKEIDLVDIVSHGKINAVKMLLANGLTLPKYILFAIGVGTLSNKTIQCGSPVIAEIVELLLDQGADPNGFCQGWNCGARPLHLMLAVGSLASVRLLLARGAHVELPSNHSNHTFIRYAADENQNLNVLQQEAEPMKQKYQAIEAALHYYHSGVTKQNKAKHHEAIADFIYFIEQTPRRLHFFARYHSALSKQALHKEDEARANLRQALLCWAEFGHRANFLHLPESDMQSIVEELMANQANLNIVDDQRNSPLHLAILNYHINFAKALIVKGLNLNSQNQNGDTPLHLAAKQGLLTLCAFLLERGVDREIVNPQGYDYEFYLAPNNNDANQLEQIRTLRQEIGLNNRRASTSAEELLTENTAGAHINAQYARQTLIEAYRNVLNNPLIAPILKVAAYATLGLHDLSGENARRLSIRIDEQNPGVDRIYGADVNAFGLYSLGGNTVYVGGNRNNRELVRGTLVHEITHFVVHEIYKNACKPYHQDNAAGREWFDRICRNLYELPTRAVRLPRLINDAFDFYREENYHAELIVRVGQIIVSIENGYQELRDRCPQLLDYYEHVFLNDCRQHFKKLSIQNNIVHNAPLVEAVLFERRHILRDGNNNNNNNNNRTPTTVNIPLPAPVTERTTNNITARIGFFEPTNPLSPTQNSTSQNPNPNRQRLNVGRRQ